MEYIPAISLLVVFLIIFIAGLRKFNGEQLSSIFAAESGKGKSEHGVDMDSSKLGDQKLRQKIDEFEQTGWEVNSVRLSDNSNLSGFYFDFNVSKSVLGKHVHSST